MRRTIHWGRRILVTLVILWGVAALVARLSTPLLEQAREPVAQWLGEKIGQPVRFARLEASWWGIGPRFVLRDVRIGSGKNAIALRSIGVDLSHISLLQGHPLDALRLTLDGLQLNLVREPDRRIHVVGMRAVAGQNGPLPLPRHLRLRHTRLQWEDRVRKAAPVVIDELELDLVRHDQDLSLHARLDSALGSIRFSGRVKGFLGQENWHGSSYLQAKGLELRQLFASYLPQHYRLNSGRMNLELWQEWQQATETSSRGHFGFVGLDLSVQQPAIRYFHADWLAGDIDYLRRSNNEWRIIADRLTTQKNPVAPSGTLAIHRHLQGNERRFDVGASELPVAVLRDLALLLPADPGLSDALQGLQPRGQIRDLRLSLWPDNSPRWLIDTRLQAVGLDPWRSVPGIQGLDIHLVGDNEYATLELAGQNMQLDYRRLFREVLPVSQLHGNLSWRQADDGWTLFSDKLALTTPDLAARAWFEYQHAPDRPPSLHLLGRISEGNAAATGRYLPTAIMNPKLVTWLDQSLGGGQVEQADVLVSGPLQHFPFHHTRDGVFEVVAQARAVPLHYRTGWPALQDVAARLFFHQNSLDIDLLEGRIYASRIVSAQARIDSLNPISPVRIQGQIQGPLGDELRLLQEPALSERFGHIAKALQVNGEASLKLDFQVPLKHSHGDYRLNGVLHLHNDRLALSDWELTIDRIRGDLEISLDALRAKGIEGIALGAPLRVDVQPTSTAASRIHAQATWPVEVLQRRFPSLPLQLASGAAPFTVDLDIPGSKAAQDAQVQIAVSSTLKGIRLDLPPPLGKSQQEERRLQVRMPLNAQPGALHIRYGSKLDARISSDGARGEIRYGRGTSRLPDAPGFNILAKLPRIELSAWLRLGERLPGGAASPPWRMALATPLLALGSVEFPDVQLDANGAAAQVNARIQGPSVAGEIHYRKGEPAVVMANLSRLHLKLPHNDTPVGPVPDPGEGPDPRNLPQLDLQCADLRLDQAKLEKLKLSLRPIAGGSRIEALTIKGPSGTLNATGNWLWKDNAAHTRLSGRLQSPDLGELLAGLGYPRQVRDAKTDLRFDFGWPGNPAQVHRATLQGTAELSIRDGRLSKVDPGVARILGLLSLDALQRRLKLDFGDLLKKGYSFDTIEGHFTLGDGQARTGDLVVDGPSGRIEVGGRLGLVARDFDQVAQVTPKLDATLVIASTIAGGPVAGAATFLAQRLLSDEVDRLNRFVYSVTGSWDDPKLTPLRGGGAVSKVLNTLSGEKPEAQTRAQKEALDEAPKKRGLLERLFGKRDKSSANTPAPDVGLPATD